MTKKFGEITTGLITCFCVVFGWIVVYFSKTDGSFVEGPLVFMAGLFVVMASNAIFRTTTQTLLAKFATPLTQGATMGSCESFNAVAGVVGPLISGYIYGAGGKEIIPLLTAGAYVIAFLTLNVVAKMEKKKKSLEKKDEGDEPVDPKEKLVKFDDVRAELIYLRFKVHELQVENNNLRLRSRVKSGSADGGRGSTTGIELTFGQNSQTLEKVMQNSIQEQSARMLL